MTTSCPAAFTAAADGWYRTKKNKSHMRVYAVEVLEPDAAFIHFAT